MKKDRKANAMGIIFSTNPDFDIEGAGVEKMKTLSTQDQQLFLHLERKKEEEL